MFSRDQQAAPAQLSGRIPPVQGQSEQGQSLLDIRCALSPARKARISLPSLPWRPWSDRILPDA